MNKLDILAVIGDTTLLYKNFVHEGLLYADLFYKYNGGQVYKQTIIHPAPQQIH